MEIDVPAENVPEHEGVQDTIPLDTADAENEYAGGGTNWTTFASTVLTCDTPVCAPLMYWIHSVPEKGVPIAVDGILQEKERLLETPENNCAFVGMNEEGAVLVLEQPSPFTVIVLPSSSIWVIRTPLESRVGLLQV